MTNPVSDPQRLDAAHRQATSPKGTSSRVRPRPVSGTTAVVLAAGLVVTAALTTLTFLNYNHSERSLVKFQGSLAAAVLQAAPIEVEAQLDRVVGLAAESSDPSRTFATAFHPLMAPKGPYASAGLILIRTGSPTQVAHVGAAALRKPTSPVSRSLFMQAAASHTLVTTRVVGKHIQRLGYFVSAPGRDGTYVVDAAQQLPLGKQVSVPPSTPASNDDFALYFGRATTADLVEADVASLPITGTKTVSHVKFGTHTLTLVLAPRSPLSGRWSSDLRWAVLVLGVILSLLVAGLTQRLSRRRYTAEQLAAENEGLYRQQREVAATMQRALLPRSLPEVDELELAARYVPAAAGVDVGGDWYSVLNVGPSETFFIVGDVSGHGIEAAAVMGTLRFTVRTLVRLNFKPGDVLKLTNPEIDIAVDQHFATAVVGLVNTEREEITLASAGHIRPLIIRDGQASFVQMPVGLPLGVGGGDYEEVVVPFPRGTTLVAFTDGLVERRGEDLGTALNRAREAASAPSTNLEELLDHVLTTVARSDHEDDIAVLALRH